MLKTEKMETKLSIRGRGIHINKTKSSKIQREFQFNVCLWIAMGMTTQQVLERTLDRLGVKTSKQNINNNYRYGKKWKKTISYLRERYLRNMSHIPLANKAKRVAMLEDIRREAMTWRTKSKNAYGIVKEIKIGVALQAVEAARREIEGDKGINLNFTDNRKFQQFNFGEKSGDEIADFLTSKLKNRG